MASLRWLTVVVAALVVGACSSPTPNPPGLPPCADGTACHSAGVGFSEGSGASAASAGSAGSSSAHGSATSGAGGGETATATGKVVAVDDLGFDASSAYAKAATIYAEGPSGKQITQAYSGSPFAIDGVATGNTWFLVAPKDTSDTVFPTYSMHRIPTDELLLPVLDKQVLTSIAFAAQLAPSAFEAQIVLRVTDGTKPLSGVSATSAGAGAILFDLGSASYSAQVTSTGDRGIVVLLNQSASRITLTDAKAQQYLVDVRPDAGTATLLDIVIKP